MSDAEDLRILAIDDDVATLELIREALVFPHVEVLTAADPVKGLQLVSEHRPELVICDLKMPAMGGMEVLERVLALSPQCDVVLLTGDYSPESAVEAIQSGASDYLTKPISVRALRSKIREFVDEAARRKRAVSLEREATEANRFQGIIGRSPAMAEVFQRIRRVAPHFRNALVLGETGTGKELTARALHKLSPVANGPFVVCNCSAVVESLFESELFGHVKGAFTGATGDKVGYFELADGGTLFLDELGDLPLSMQTKMLRTIQHQELQRVGSPKSKKVSVRIVGATNQDLHSMMEKGEFRQDLFYRLSMVEIRLPRLADRPEDLPLLVRHFVNVFATQFEKRIDDVAPRALAALARHDWPGNIRELENVIGNACMMAEGRVIDLADLPGAILQACDSVRPPEPPDVNGILPLEEVQRRYARQALDHCEGNKAKAADVLGISRSTLYKLLK